VHYSLQSLWAQFEKAVLSKEVDRMVDDFTVREAIEGMGLVHKCTLIAKDPGGIQVESDPEPVIYLFTSRIDAMQARFDADKFNSS